MATASPPFPEPTDGDDASQSQRYQNLEHHLCIRSDELRHYEKENRDFPGGAEVKNPPANAGDMGSSPGPGRSHMPQSN